MVPNETTPSAVAKMPVKKPLKPYARQYCASGSIAQLTLEIRPRSVYGRFQVYHRRS